MVMNALKQQDLHVYAPPPQPLTLNTLKLQDLHFYGALPHTWRFMEFMGLSNYSCKGP